MGIFKHNEEPRRSIDDILTPKEEDANEEELDMSAFTEEEFDKVDENKVENEEKESKKPTVDAFDCFGVSEDKAEKWLKKCIKAWYYIISFFWFLFGTITFAPIIFIRDNIDVVFKDKKKSLLCATIIHISLIALFIGLIILMRKPPKA